MAVITEVIAATELAAKLTNLGLYTTIEAAYDAILANPAYTVVGEGATGYILETSYVADVVGGAAEAVVSSTETALEVAQSTSLVATEQSIATSGVAITETAGGYTASGLLAVDLGIVAAAASPILGVALGAGLYELNPELWTKISQKLLPFCYPDTTLIPAWADILDSTWTVKIAKDVVDALKDLFDEEHIGKPEYPAGPDTPGGTYSTGMSAVDFLTSLGWEVYDPNGYLDGVSGACACRRLPPWLGQAGWDVVGICGTISVTETSFRGPSISANFTNEYPYRLTIRSYGGSTSLTKSDVVATSIGYDPSTSYPAGTEEWEGTTPSEIPLADPIVTGLDDLGNAITKDTVPISIPKTIGDDWKPGKPAVSPDPSEQPDPTVTSFPDEQISPYIQPTPTPNSVTNPDQLPQPQPEPDPSKPPEKTKTITEYLDPPVPIGYSPISSVPSTELPFSSTAGLITVYHPSSAQLYSFEQWLWVTYADATIDKIWNNPFDGVITLFELYCDPTDVGNRNIKCGFLDSGINSPVISRYTEIDCGTLGIPEYYGNYLDYSPYSRAHIYLPFIGIQELNVDDIVGHAVNVTYRIDEYNGSCIALITVAKVTQVNGEDAEYSNVMYQFSGNCAVELPLSGGSQAAIRAGMMQADAWQTASQVSVGANLIGGLASAAMGAITGSPGFLAGAVSSLGNAASQYASGKANYLSNMLSGKSTVQKSGSFGSSHGALGIKKPFITVTRPKQIQVANYEELYGFPAHKMVTIGSCTGFLRCREVHVLSATATDAEKTQIEQLLKAGVYVTE